MENVLKDGTFTDSEKVTKYTDTMQRYMDYQNQYNLPHTQVVPSAAAVPMQTETEEGGEDMKQGIQNNTPTIHEEPIVSESSVKDHNGEGELKSVTDNPNTKLPGEKSKISTNKKLKVGKEYFFTNPWLEC